VDAILITKNDETDLTTCGVQVMTPSWEIDTMLDTLIIDDYNEPFEY